MKVFTRAEAMDCGDTIARILTAESQAIQHIPIVTLVEQAPLVCQLLLSCRGKVVLTGMGKNGHIAARVAATLSSTGTPAVFMHPGEAAHGDLGMLCVSDVLMALSNSGKTREVCETAERVQAFFPDVPIVVVTGERTSPLALLADHVLWYGAVTEPCPLGLTPSASLAAMSALLDGIALAVMQARGWTTEQWSHFHHQGYLGQKARGKV